eukprot:TRINITY_DN5485_c0_g1_i10.p2 TRINITY_DN5485_c0_g1~~TRINITY_DN5485_c0_g1_i10.p2  ORF type:complete len:133 (-),score=28.01 TRINITY_DN5485_c0_g1_i10:669-1067(-)
MWRFLAGVSEPPAKKIKSEEEKKKQSKEYEKRDRKWVPGWKRTDTGEERGWLVYDADKKEMHCAPCRKWMTTYKQQQQPFVLGTKLFKLDSIKKHEQSVGHRDCCQKESAQKDKKSTAGARPVRLSVKEDSV